MKKNIIIVLVALIAIAVGLFAMTALIDKGRGLAFRHSQEQFQKMYAEAKDLETKGSYLNAQAMYKGILDKSKDPALLGRIDEALMALNTKILFSPLQTDDSAVYTVEPGDTLAKIARKFNTTVQLVMKSNGLASDMIREGQKLKVSTAVYSILVDYSDNVLFLKADGDVIKKYTVATGINNSTPLGKFKIINKLKDPTWFKAGAVVPPGSDDNILGTRWMGLSVAGYGIHGTTIPESIGQHATAGCVRMLMSDVEELYDIMPVGAEVEVVD